MSDVVKDFCKSLNITQESFDSPNTDIEWFV